MKRRVGSSGKTWRSISMLLALLGSLGTTRSPVAARNIDLAQLDQKGFPTIQLFLAVRTKEGKVENSLEPGSFRVFEDGRPVLLSGFEAQKGASVLDIVFVFDTTGSMFQEIEDLKDIALQLADRLRKQSIDFRLGLVTFGDEIRKVGGFTPQAPTFKEWIRVLKADGGGDTPEVSLDAMAWASEMPFRQNAHKMLILITDAPPHLRSGPIASSPQTSSQRRLEVIPPGLAKKLTDYLHSGLSRSGRGRGIVPSFIPSEIVSMAKRRGVVVYAISPDIPEYRSIVEQTEGVLYNIEERRKFKVFLEKIIDLIIGHYRLAYNSPVAYKDGTYRRVDIRINSGRSTNSATKWYYVPGVFVPASDGMIFAGLLIPLIFLLFVPVFVRKGS